MLLVCALDNIFMTISLISCLCFVHLVNFDEAIGNVNQVNEDHQWNELNPYTCNIKMDSKYLVNQATHLPSPCAFGQDHQSDQHSWNDYQTLSFLKHSHSSFLSVQLNENILNLIIPM